MQKTFHTSIVSYVNLVHSSKTSSLLTARYDSLGGLAEWIITNGYKLAMRINYIWCTLHW